jgi:hypothetical protein
MLESTLAVTGTDFTAGLTLEAFWASRNPALPININNNESLKWYKI